MTIKSILIFILGLPFYLGFNTNFIVYFNNNLKNKYSLISNIKMEDNPLVDYSGLPRFKSIKTKHIKPGITSLLTKLKEDFLLLENELNKPNISDHKLSNLINDHREIIEFPLGYSWGIVSHLNSVCNSNELRDIYDELQPLVIEQMNYMSQSKILYDSLKVLKDNLKIKLEQIKKDDDLEKLTKDQQNSITQLRIYEKELQGMELSGINLNSKDQERFNQISLELGSLSSKFSNNLLDSTKSFKLIIKDPDIMKDVPKSSLEIFSQEAHEKFPESTPEKGPWILTLDSPSYISAMKYISDSNIRKKLYQNYVTRASSDKTNNLPIIDKILKNKKELSNLINFNNYAELSISKKMATKPEIDKLIELIFEKAFPISKIELEEIQKFASEELDTPLLRLNNWDIPYWTEKVKEKKLDFKEEDLKPYFEFENVLKGLFDLSNLLFNIKIEEVNTLKESIETWNKDVKYFRIFDSKNIDEEIASFFIDPYSRPSEKRGGAWMNGCISKSKNLNKKPVAYLICNGTPPITKGKNKKPSLMTFSDVETLFHEFGHGLQHMLTTVENSSASGINNIEWDAVELPSQFMENWCYHKPTLLKFANHYETKEKLPDHLFSKIIEKKKFMSGLGISRQIYISQLDMYLYNDLADEETPLECQKKIAEKYLVTPYYDDDKFICAFSHIFAGGYAAGYYSYKWAEVMSADCFGKFEEIDMNDSEKLKEIGMEFRNTILSLGGSIHPSKVFKMFRGRDPNPDAFLKHNLNLLD